MTKSQAVATDVSALLRSRHALLWITTKEEARVERLLFEAAQAAGYVPRTWDCADGVCSLGGRKESMGSKDLDDTLATIEARSQSSGADRGVWILRDAHGFLDGPIFASTLRKVRNLARSLPKCARDRSQAIIVITPSSKLPPELEGHATVIDWPLPDREEIAGILTSALAPYPTREEFEALSAADKEKVQLIRDEAIADEDARQAAIDAAVGLSGEEAANCYAKSLVQSRRIDPVAVQGEKKRIISREKVLEWYDPIPGGLDAVGGLDGLKAWLAARAQAYTPAARAYGLPAPKGAMLVGIPGCGKSLTAKAIPTAWGMPLLRLDLNGLKGKFLGESEGNLRKALRVVEAIGKCVVWIDEIEKALAGATSGVSDGGVSADALGTILSWLQERASQAFVVVTANDVEALPPELLRKGRFDEVFWIDLPTPEERDAILRASLKAYGRDAAAVSDARFSFAEVVDATEGFTGSEIAELVPAAMFQAFSEGAREITAEDLVAAAKEVRPLSKVAAPKIAKLRQWQQERGARPATLAPVEVQPDGLRLVDMG